jgi:hypothetical protein
MSFEGSKSCFAENIHKSRELSDPSLKAIMWNLNKGLLDLVTDLEQRLDSLDLKMQSRSR